MKLRPGPGRSSAEVHADQQARLRAAMVELVAERGYEGVTVRSLARLAAVSTRTFYKHFPNTEECFAATYESLVRATARRARRAAEAGESWEEDVRAALGSVLTDVARYPKEARLVLVEAFVLGPGLHPRMRAAVDGFEQLLLRCFTAAPHEIPAPNRLAQGVVAAVAHVAGMNLLAHPTEIGGELGDWIVSLCAGHPMVPEPSQRRPTSNGTRHSGPMSGEPAAAIVGAFGDDRGRILAAAAKLALTSGFSGLTIPKIRAEAGVSRRRFDTHFEDVEDCFLEVIEELATSVALRAKQQATEATCWESQIHQTIASLCTDLATEPLLAHLIFVEILSAGGKGLKRRERLVSLMAAQLPDTALPAPRPSRLAAEASAAAAWRIAQAEIASGQTRSLSDLIPILTQLALASSVDPVAGTTAANHPA